ncbi:MAG: hypothetical protein ABI723_26065 [Bacteroidia bacterium]
MKSVTKEIEAIKPSVVGRTLTNLYHTKLSEKFELLPGVSHVLYFRTIIELDHTEHYDFWKSYLNKWNSTEQLFPVSNEQWDVPDSRFFIGQKVKDIKVDHHGQVYLILENDIAIEHTIDYGDGIRIKPFKELIEAEER